jgi:hypothetical protein
MFLMQFFAAANQSSSGQVLYSLLLALGLEARDRLVVAGGEEGELCQRLAAHLAFAPAESKWPLSMGKLC